MMKRWVAVMLSILLMGTMAGCGHKSNDGEKVVAAMEKMSTVQSYRTALSTQMRLKVPESGTVAMSVEMEAACMVSPMKANVDMKFRGMGQTLDLSMYLQQKGDVYEVYVLDGDQWRGMEMSPEEVGQMDPQTGLQIYVANSQSFRHRGKEIINGQAADRYDGVLAGKDLLKALKMMENTPGFPLQELELEEVLPEEMGGLSVSLWIDPVSGYPVYYRMDMSDFMEKTVRQLLATLGLEDLDVSVEQLEVTMSFTDFDEVPDFSMPESAATTDV